MLSKATVQTRVGAGVLVFAILIGMLLVDRFVELSSWAWAGFLTIAGAGLFGLYLADRSHGLTLLAAHVLGVTAGLIAFIPSGFLRDEAVAAYVLLAITLPLLVTFARDRTRWWALMLAYPLLVILGVIGLAASRLFRDDLISAYVLVAMAIPFFVTYARNRKRWWALVVGSILGMIGLSFGTWLSWQSFWSSLMQGLALAV
jgi:hypothetical protein